MRKLKYPMSAILNNEGMELFGDVFPDKRIPVLNPLSHETKLEGVGEKKVYLVNLSLLKRVDEATYKKLLNKLSEKFNAPIEAMGEIYKHGLPLRAELVASVEIDPRFVI
ncbi:MAG: hypothetical protein ACYS76_04440, partial [Planctomycetota bacterium]|jgi:hypothetical protein